MGCSLETGTLRAASARNLGRSGHGGRRRCAAAGLVRVLLWSARDQPVDVVEAGREHDAVDQDEQDQRGRHRIGGER